MGKRYARGVFLIPIGALLNSHNPVRLKKFTGGMGDEDEEDDNTSEEEMEKKWQRFFSKPLTEVKQVVATEKANGESAHFSVRWLGEGVGYLFVAGSKNVHVIFRSLLDLDGEWYEEVRFGTAKKIARSILEDIEAMSPTAKEEWLSFLASTGVTVIYEYLQPQYQHVELVCAYWPSSTFFCVRLLR